MDNSLDKKAIIEDLVKICIDSYTIILKGSFSGEMSDDISNHLKLCVQIIDSCTIKEDKDA
jgi:hypothetical protein